MGAQGAIWQAQEALLEARLTRDFCLDEPMVSSRGAPAPRSRVKVRLKVRPAARLAVALRSRPRYETQLRAALN